MAKTPEAKVKEQVKKIFDEFGVYYFMPFMGGYGRTSIPDFVACYKGKFIAVEAKAGKNVPTTLQEIELQNIRDRRGYALVINESNIDELRSTLNWI